MKAIHHVSLDEKPFHPSYVSYGSAMVLKEISDYLICIDFPRSGDILGWRTSFEGNMTFRAPARWASIHR